MQVQAKSLPVRQSLSDDGVRILDQAHTLRHMLEDTRLTYREWKELSRALNAILR